MGGSTMTLSGLILPILFYLRLKHAIPEAAVAAAEVAIVDHAAPGESTSSSHVTPLATPLSNNDTSSLNSQLLVWKQPSFAQ